MATPCRIPPVNTTFDEIRIALNERRDFDAIVIYNKLTDQEKTYFATMYPEIYQNLYRAYMRLIS